MIVAQLTVDRDYVALVQQGFAPNKVRRYGPLNTRDIVKLCAVAFMFVDHIGEFIAADDPLLRTIGRAAPPLFFFLVGFASSYRWSNQLLIDLCILTVTNVIL